MVTEERDRLTFRPVADDNWHDLELLFEAPGGPKHCWCMVWRRSSEEAKNPDGKFRKSLLKARVESGEPIGILGYQADRPVAWCSIGPRGAHRPGMAKAQPGDESQTIWSLVCFFVPRKLRRRGIMRQLIAAAEEEARSQGATILEAYPVDEDTPSYRFGGFVDVFLTAGFDCVGQAGVRRKIVRRKL